jgi:hypothetical protein
MYPSPAKSLAGHRINSSASFRSPSWIAHCPRRIYSVCFERHLFGSLRLNIARDDRIEQKDEEAAYGEPGISLLYHVEMKSGTLGRVATLR